MQFISKDKQPKIAGKKRYGRALAAALFLQTAPSFTDTAMAQQAHQERVTASQVYRQTPINPVRLARLGENPVVRNGGILSLNEIHATRDVLAPDMQDWAENDFENTLRLISGYRAGATATSDADLIQRIETTLASAPRVAGMNQEVDVTSLLQANGYQVGTGVQVTLEAVSGGESQMYKAGTQADGPDGVKAIPLGAHDGLLVAGDGNGANESIRIRISRVVNRSGQYVTETVAVDAADYCGNAFLLPYMEETAPGTAIETNPCPEPLHINVETGLPAGSVVTRVYAINPARASELHTVDGQQCPAASTIEPCRGCTSEVANISTGETAAILGHPLSILEEETLQVQNGGVRIDIRSTINIPLANGRFVTVNLRDAIERGIVNVIISCPRRPQGGNPRLGNDSRHGVYTEASDWSHVANDDRGEKTLRFRYDVGGEYRIISDR